MKTILFSLTILFFSVVAYAQQKPIDKFNHDLYRGKLTNKDFFTKADFIFEAERVKGETYLNDDSTKVFYASVWNVTEIYKGGNILENGTVEIILDAGYYNRIWIENGEGKAFTLDYNTEFCYHEGAKNIFFCTASDFSESPFNFETDNAIDLKLLKNEPYANFRFESSTDYNFTIYGLNNLYFKTKQEFYDYAKQYKGTDVPGSDKKKAEQKLGLERFLKEQYNRVNTAKSNTGTDTSKVNTLQMNIENQTVTGSVPYYFEFR